MSIGAKVNHPSFGEGVIFGETENAWRIYFKEKGEEQIGKAFDEMQTIEVSDLDHSPGISLEDVVEAVQIVFDGYYDVQ